MSLKVVGTKINFVVLCLVPILDHLFFVNTGKSYLSSGGGKQTIYRIQRGSWPSQNSCLQNYKAFF